MGNQASVKDDRALFQGLCDGLFGVQQPGLDVFVGLDGAVGQLDELRLGLHQLGGSHQHGVEPRAADLVRERFPDAEYHPLSGVLRVWRDKTIHGKGPLIIACAGTSDLPVAEEAFLTAQIMGNDVELIADIGVAGIHRLMSNRERLTQARVCVVCAGMEGALPSVVGGLVSCPVIAVPTSVGYGASFHGLAALLGMLNSCASNVTVVNIDNGFGGGYVAGLINRLG